MLVQFKDVDTVKNLLHHQYTALENASPYMTRIISCVRNQGNPQVNVRSEEDFPVIYKESGKELYKPTNVSICQA